MRESRAHAGITRAEAAKRIGLSSSQLGRIERGHVTMCDQPVTLVSAGRVYGVSNLWLYAGEAAGAKFVPEWYGAPALTLEAA
jgi:transcriptional regulator with XRE-family HTH domain